ncbi:hypothetical protein EXN66_Car003894 [Channa argus]|uniref:Uncharacterized protein n=1 Tax=Channa argus TaxID=215402 RepID=A0A6G1PDA5_CHAAH|nr:hypothetical protein EXN66_Car003894 [Channa argus]
MVVNSTAPAYPNSLIQIYNPSRPLCSANEQSGGPSTAQKTPSKTLQLSDPTVVERATKLCTLSKLTQYSKNC